MSAAAADPRTIRAILIVIGAAALAGPMLVVRFGPVVSAEPRIVRLHRRVIPPASLPPVDPVRFVDMSPDEARAYNATVPFSDDPNPAARPFRFAGTDEDAARATDCLAAAVVYEAGDDATGERAVAQVVVNRLRHPAFPKTVCGVVFEGAERSTGCQFTFTCDGALTRWTPSEAAWKRAREVAALALAGSVFRPVGYSTHYHTDWVVPYWQSSLDKVAGIGSHLFFRWAGWWGTPPAFTRRLLPGEPAEAKMATLSDDHRLGAAVDEATDAQTLADALLAGAGLTDAGAEPASAMPLPTASDPDVFLTTLDPRQPAESYRTLALRTCADRVRCLFMGWTDPRQTATVRPLSDAQVAAMSFSYMRERGIGLDRALWNCDVAQRADPQQCMKRGTGRAPASLPVLRAGTAAPTAPASTPTPAAPLTGIHRRPAAAPTSTPPRTSPAPAP